MKSLFPHDRIRSAFDIDYPALYKAGIRAVFFDIDNTLVPHDAPADEAARRLVERIKSSGLLVYIISNNREPRVRSFSDDAGCSGYIFKAGKPLAKGFNRALDILGLKKDEAIYIGDQIFTDTAGGRNAGLWTILTCPISPREPFNIVLKRIAEAPVIAIYCMIKMIFGPKKKVPLIRRKR